MSYNRMIISEDSKSVNIPIIQPSAPAPNGKGNGTESKPMDCTGNSKNLPGIILQAIPPFKGGPRLETGQMQENGLEAKNIIFNDQSIRKGFIRKVYFILLTQLLFTCGVISIFMYHEPTKLFVQDYPMVVCLAMIVNLVVMLSMACCETARRSFPINFVCLALFTMTMSLLLGSVAGSLDDQIVLMGVGITALLVISLSIFAIQTKYDFTAWRGIIISVIICLIVLAFAGMFLRGTFGDTALSCLGALLASFLLIFDTQMIIGGTHKYQFNPEDYIFAALTLYVDVVRIFVYILRMARN